MDAIKKRYFGVKSVDSVSERPGTSSKKKKVEEDTVSDEVGGSKRIVKYKAKVNTPYLNRLELVHGSAPELVTNLGDNDADDLGENVKLGNLPPNELQWERCAPLNIETKDEGNIILSIKFNPVNNVALVAGKSVVNMIKVTSGKSHPLLQRISFDKMELKEVVWSFSSTDFYVTSRKDGSNWFGHYNLAAGKFGIVKPKALKSYDRVWKLIADPLRRYLIALGNGGRIHVLSETTKEVVDTLHMGLTVSDATFSSDGRMLYTFGGDGEIYIWDMNTRERIAAWYDDSTWPHVPSEPHIFARCSEYMAFGSETGIVNVYSNSDLQDSREHKNGNTNQELPQPRTVNKTLTSAITSMAMNSHSEILAVASNCKEGALRLLHLPSMTTFKNFVPAARELGSVYCLDFSPASGFLSFGNDRGTAFLYRLKHYAAY